MCSGSMKEQKKCWKFSFQLNADNSEFMARHSPFGCAWFSDKYCWIPPRNTNIIQPQSIASAILIFFVRCLCKTYSIFFFKYRLYLFVALLTCSASILFQNISIAFVTIKFIHNTSIELLAYLSAFFSLSIPRLITSNLLALQAFMFMKRCR